MHAAFSLFAHTPHTKHTRVFQQTMARAQHNEAETSLRASPPLMTLIA
jgi:hypothetical protein